MNALFISDLHLDDPNSSRFGALSNLLRDAIEERLEVFILGDLTEVWVGDDDDSSFAESLKNLLRECTKTIPIYLMNGNRDFLYGDRFESETGVALISDPYILRSGPHAVLLAHGDAYCTEDVEYQKMRSILRSPETIEGLLAQTLEQRRDLAQRIRQQSIAANELKAENIMDVTTEAIRTEMRSKSCEILIHGHTHRPAVHREDWGVRYVLGNWEHCGWFLKMTGQDIDLKCFPIL